MVIVLPVFDRKYLGWGQCTETVFIPDIIKGGVQAVEAVHLDCKQRWLQSVVTQVRKGDADQPNSFFLGQETVEHWDALFEYCLLGIDQWYHGPF